jgi:thiamine kinase-like enzyme
MRPPDLESLAERHVPGSGPLHMYPLRSGLVNETYRVLRDGVAYALRVAAANPYGLGVDPLWEAQVLERAAIGRLAPALAYGDPKLGVLITHWVDGRSWDPAEVRRPANILRMAELMRRIHAVALPQPARVMSPAQWIDYYAAAGAGAGPRVNAGAGAAAALHTAARERLAALAALPAQGPVLCHSDLHTQNLLDRGSSLVLLDWEYAHASDPLWDLAGWSANNDLEESQQQELLANYLGRAPTPHESLRLRLLCWLYDYVCLLWSELYLNPRRESGSVGEAARGEVFGRARLLAARLDASK